MDAVSGIVAAERGLVSFILLIGKCACLSCPLCTAAAAMDNMNCGVPVPALDNRFLLSFSLCFIIRMSCETKQVKNKTTKKYGRNVRTGSRR